MKKITKIFAIKLILLFQIALLILMLNLNSLYSHGCLKDGEETKVQYIIQKYNLIDTTKKRTKIIPTGLINYRSKYLNNKCDSIFVIIEEGFNKDSINISSDGFTIINEMVTTSKLNGVAKSVNINKTKLTSDSLTVLINNNDRIALKIIPGLNYFRITRKNSEYLGNYFEVIITNLTPYFQ